jgi:hypothetical protein
VNKVQLDIRTGHAQTVDKVIAWLSDGALPGTTVCDVRAPRSALPRRQPPCSREWHAWACAPHARGACEALLLQPASYQACRALTRAPAPPRRLAAAPAAWPSRWR